MAVKFANNARTLLAAGIGTGDVSLSIAAEDAAKFPALAAGDWFPVTVIDSGGNMEVMRCTARAGAALTVVRAQEATTAKAFASGAIVSLRPTAAMMNDIYSYAFTKTEIQLSYYTKAAIDGLVTALNATIASKQPSLGFTPVNKAGDVMTGPLQIFVANPRLNLTHPPNGATRTLYHDGTNMGFLNTGGGYTFRVADSGALWTSQLGDISTYIETRASAQGNSWANDRISRIQSRFVSQGNTGGNTNVEAPSGAVISGYYREGGSTGQVAFLYYRYLQIFDPVRGWVSASSA